MDNWKQLSVPCTLSLREIVRIGRVKRLPWMEGRFAYVWNGNLDSAGRIVLRIQDRFLRIRAEKAFKVEEMPPVFLLRDVLEYTELFPMHIHVSAFIVDNLTIKRIGRFLTLRQNVSNVVLEVADPLQAGQHLLHLLRGLQL